MLLVPEINLTPQLVDRIQRALPDARTAVLHSRLAAGERQRQWLATASGDAHLLVGTRLAVFTPMPRLGLIIVDEEQDTSFKQQEGVRYHARDVAIYRARLRDIPIDARQRDAVAGKLRTGNTGTLPLAEAAAQGRARRGASGRATWFRIAPRAASRASDRELQARSPRGSRATSRSLLFINRRGFAPSLLCAACGWKAMCPRCAARLVVHRDAGTAVLPSLRSREGDSHCVPRLRQSGPAAAGIGNAAPGARRRRTVSCGADRARRSRQHAPQGLVRGHAQRDRGRRRGHHDRHADARQGPRFSAPDTGWRAWRRQRAVQRRISRDRAVVRAARAGRGSRGPRCPAPAKCWCRPIFPNTLSIPRWCRTTTIDSPTTLLAERKNLGLPPFAHLALLERRGEAGRRRSTPFYPWPRSVGAHLPPRTEAACEVFSPVPAALPRRAGLERAQVLAQSAIAARCRSFFRHGATNWIASKSAACAGVWMSTRSDSRDRDPSARIRTTL